MPRNPQVSSLSSNCKTGFAIPLAGRSQATEKDPDGDVLIRLQPAGMLTILKRKDLGQDPWRYEDYVVQSVRKEAD